MDHKVSKDMISSGMIPSGEKTQADLGRTQYGSTPSPSSLMEAYRSIYEHHQKDENGNTIPHEGEELNEALPLAPLAVAAGMTGASIYGANLLRKSLKKDKPTEVKPTNPSGKVMPKPSKPSKPVPQMNDVDLFDLVKGKLIDEGCGEKEALKIMATMSKEEFDEVSEGLAGMALKLGGAALGAYGVKKAAEKMGTMSGTPKPVKKPGLIQQLKNRRDATNKAIEQM